VPGHRPGTTNRSGTLGRWARMPVREASEAGPGPVLSRSPGAPRPSPALISVAARLQRSLEIMRFDGDLRHGYDCAALYSETELQPPLMMTSGPLTIAV
jgi:hypothetical protein